MSNELTIQDVKALALREDMKRHLDERVVQLELTNTPMAQVAPTIFTVRRLGGTGASILTLSLEYLLKQSLLHIEIGGAPSPALKARGSDGFLHFPSNEPDRIDKALDARLRSASRTAVFEFEPALYQQTLDIATAFKRQVGPSKVLIFYIAGRHDPFPKFGVNACNRGLSEVFLCRQASQSYEADPDGLIKLPWIGDAIISSIMRDGLSLVDALKQTDGLWTSNMTRLALEAFGTALWEAGR